MNSWPANCPSQAFEEMVAGMEPLVTSSTNPWLHALYAWALAQLLSIKMHTAFMNLRQGKVGR
jgi:hypothetical protein